MVANQKFTVNTIDAVVAAILAYRQNQNKILRHSVQFLEENQKENKQLIYDFFAENKSVPTDLRAEAESIRSSLNQRVMMNNLVGVKNSDFLADVNSILQSETVSSSKFGLVAWSPKLFDDHVRADSEREQVISLSIGSTYLGKVSKAIELTWHSISATYLQSYDSFVLIGHDGAGNLINTWSKTRIDDGARIKARVKAHKADERFSRAKFTVLNYVKVVNEK